MLKMFLEKYLTTKQTERSPFMLSVSKLIGIKKMAKKGNNKCNHPIDDDHGGSRPQDSDSKSW